MSTFDPAARGRLLAKDSALRSRWPNLASLSDLAGNRLLSLYESLLSHRACVERQYRAFTGEPLDLENPRSLSEKLQWLKLHDVTPLHTQCADKLAAREYVRERVGEEHLIPLLLATDQPGDINPRTIRAERFAAKTNHDWGGVVLCRDRNTFDWQAARDQLSRHLQRSFWRTFRERAYRGIVPAVLVEALLQPSGGGGLRDYKIFCFHGRPGFVQVVDDRNRDATWTMYDLGWTMLDVRRRGRPRSSVPHKRPARLDIMLAIAERLAEPFRFCRVDLYEVDGRVYFGEITFYPEAGYRPFEPAAFERKLGDMLRLD